MISPTVHSLTTHASPPPNIIVKGNKQHVADSNYTSTIQSLKKINQKSAHSVKENLFEKIQGLINQCVISIRYLYKTFRNFLRPPTIPVPKPTMINPNINSPTPIHRGIEPLAHLVTNHSIQQLISQIDKIFNSSKALILELQTHLNAHVVKFESSIKFEGQPFVKALGDNISEKYDHFIVEYQNLSRTVSNCQSQIKDILFKYYTEKNYNYIPPLKEEQIKDLQLQLDLVKETISNFLEKSLLELKWVEEKKCELLKKSIENLEHKNKLLNNFEILKNKHEELSKELQEIRHNHKSIKFHEKAEKNTFKVSNQLNDELSNNLNKLLISIEKLEIKSTSWYLKPFQKLYTTTSDTLNNAYGYSKNALFSVDFETGLETHKNQLDSFKDRLQFLKSHTDHEKSLIKITELEKLTIKTENCYEMILSQLDSNKNHQVKLNELFKIQSRLRTIREVEIDLIESTKRLQDNKQEILNSKALIHDDKKCISLTNDLLKNAEEIYKAETKLINKIPSLKSLLAHFK